MADFEIPGYELYERLGKGGMASVYRALHLNLDRIVAIKVMDPRMNSDESFSERFIREARISARLVHPHILDRIRRRLATLETSGFRGVVVVDAALLLDWKLERELDAVIAVTSPESTRLDRLNRSRGWSADEARRRLGVQPDDARLAAAADVVLDNQGTPEALARAALEAVQDLRARTGRR